MLRSRLFWVALVLVTAGAVVPFLIILGVLPNSLWLNFASYLSSVSGLFLGLLSTAAAYAERRRNDRRDDMWAE